MEKTLVSVIIVNWNGADFISQCLKTFFKQTYKNFEVIVVDNNSSDASCEVIKKIKNVKLIASDTNLGFAGGNNLGLTKAKGKYILLLNTDTTAPSDLLTVLVDAIEKDTSLGVVQPKVLYENKTINSIGAYMTSTGFLYYPGYGKKDKLPQYNKEQYVFTAYGACMLIRKTTIDKIGLFDDDYFMYFEETDFCMRVWMAGWKILYTPKTTILHKGGVSSKKFGMEKIYFHSFKNRICSYLKNLDTISLIKILPVHLLICEGTSIIYLITGKVPFFIAVQKAIFWNIFQLSNILNKRSKIIRKVKDAEYFTRTLKSPRLSYYLYLFKGLQYYKD